MLRSELEELLESQLINTGLKYNVYQNDNGVKLEIATPGIKKENISAVFKNKTLFITAKYEKVEENDDEVLIYKGFKTQDINRELRFDNDYVDITAKYFNGVLIVNLLREKTLEKVINIV